MSVVLGDNCSLVCIAGRHTAHQCRLILMLCCRQNWCCFNTHLACPGNLVAEGAFITVFMEFTGSTLKTWGTPPSAINASLPTIIVHSIIAMLLQPVQVQGHNLLSAIPQCVVRQITMSILGASTLEFDLCRPQHKHQLRQGRMALITPSNRHSLTGKVSLLYCHATCHLYGPCKPMVHASPRIPETP